MSLEQDRRRWELIVRSEHIVLSDVLASCRNVYAPLHDAGWILPEM